MTLLIGKGLWLRHLAGAPALDALTARAQSARLAHVILKAADGADPVNLGADGLDLAAALTARLTAAGVAVWGWHSLYGDRPAFKGGFQPDYHRREAETIQARLAALRPAGLRGLVLEARTEYERGAARSQKAREYLAALPADLPLALSSWKAPAAHPRFPWAEFRDRCGQDLPPVFWVGQHGGAARHLQSVARQFRALTPARPLAAAGPAFFEANWRPAPNDLAEFLAAAARLGLTGVNLWLWDQLAWTGAEPAAENPRGLDFRPQWQVLADFIWTGNPEPEPLPQPAPEPTPMPQPGPAPAEAFAIIDPEPANFEPPNPEPVTPEPEPLPQPAPEPAPMPQPEPAPAEAFAIIDPEPANFEPSNPEPPNPEPVTLELEPPATEPLEPVNLEPATDEPVTRAPRVFLSPQAPARETPPAVARFFKALRTRQLEAGLPGYAAGFAHVTPDRVTHDPEAVRTYYTDLLARLPAGGPVIVAVGGAGALVRVQWSVGGGRQGQDEFHLNRAGEIVYHHTRFVDDQP